MGELTDLPDLKPGPNSEAKATSLICWQAVNLKVQESQGQQFAEYSYNRKVVSRSTTFHSDGINTAIS